MHSRESIRPFLFFFLDLPSGISSGFASITLPFVLTQTGLHVAGTSATFAHGVSAKLWRFLWGPVADLTLTARRWYLIGLITTAATLFLLSVIPLRTSSSGLIYAVVFISQVASTLVMLPLGGMMAHTVAEEAKGRAAGWYQAGNLGGNGIGGGAGVWLAAHYSKEISGAAIAAVAIIMAIAARTPASFSVGVLFYAFTNGVAYAAFSALVLLAIGKGAASTKYAALCSLGNLPVVYMTALDGWVHDRYGTAWMLHFDGLAGVVCIAFAMLALHRILRRQATLIP